MSNNKNKKDGIEKPDANKGKIGQEPAAFGDTTVSLSPYVDESELNIKHIDSLPAKPNTGVPPTGSTRQLQIKVPEKLFGKQGQSVTSTASDLRFSSNIRASTHIPKVGERNFGGSSVFGNAFGNVGTLGGSLRFGRTQMRDTPSVRSKASKPPVPPPRVTRKSYNPANRPKSVNSQQSFASSLNFRLGPNDSNRSFISMASLSRANEGSLLKNMKVLSEKKSMREVGKETEFPQIERANKKNVKKKKVSKQPVRRTSDVLVPGSVKVTKRKKSTPEQKEIISLPPSVPGTKPILVRDADGNLVSMKPVVSPTTATTSTTTAEPLSGNKSTKSLGSNDSGELYQNLTDAANPFGRRGRSSAMRFANQASEGSLMAPIRLYSDTDEEVDESKRHEVQMLARARFSADESTDTGFQNIMQELERQKSVRNSMLQQNMKSRQFRKAERQFRSALGNDAQALPNQSLRSIILGEKPVALDEPAPKKRGLFGACGECLDKGFGTFLDIIDWLPLDCKVVFVILGVSALLAYVIYFFTNDNSPDVTGLEFTVPPNSTNDS